MDARQSGRRRDQHRRQGHLKTATGGMAELETTRSITLPAW
ncbi:MULTISPECIES: hypothetical protein [Sphingomonas]|nr:hypothetical protein [Sphingomonas pituitosa]